MLKVILINLLIFFQMSYAYINIYPVKFEKDITKGASENFKLYNRTDKPVRYRIYMERVKDDSKDMYEWTEIYPKSLSLRPLEEKEVRVLITPKKDAKVGEYKGRLVVKEIGNPGVRSGKKVDFMTMFILNMKGYVTK